MRKTQQGSQHTQSFGTERGGAGEGIQPSPSNAINTLAAALCHVPSAPLSSSCQHLSGTSCSTKPAHMERQGIRFQERLKSTAKGFVPYKLPVSYSWSAVLAALLLVSNSRTLLNTEVPDFHGNQSLVPIWRVKCGSLTCERGHQRWSIKGNSKKYLCFCSWIISGLQERKQKCNSNSWVLVKILTKSSMCTERQFLFSEHEEPEQKKQIKRIF